MKINMGGNPPENTGGINLNQGQQPSAQTTQPQSPAPAQQGVISLQKGQKVSLSKAGANLDNIIIGLGWDINQFVGTQFDLDAQAFLLKGDELVRSNSDFIFYNQPSASNGSVVHSGDNLTGQGDGDDEVVKVILSKVDPDIQKIVFTVTIHDALQRGQNFGQVKNAFIRIVDENSQRELIRYDLSEDYSIETALVVGELYRHNGEWKFNAVGKGYQTDLAGFCAKFGVSI